MISNSSEVAIEITTANEKRSLFKERLENCLRSLEYYLSKPEQARMNEQLALSVNLTEINMLPFIEINTMRKGSEHKWKKWEVNTDPSLQKMANLDDIKPCLVYSYYGALLKNIYRIQDKADIKSIYHNFLRSLRSEWEFDKNFKLYRE